MTRRTVPALALAGIIGGLSALAIPAASAAPAEPVLINLVTVNDFHGRIERSGSAAGVAALATAVSEVRAANPNTVFAAAGDLIGASTFTSFIQQDNPTIDALTAAGLDVSAVGNHEFDQGYADLRDRVMPRAGWEYLGANVRTSTGGPALPEYCTETFDGVSIGFVGAVTDELPSLVRAEGIAGLVIEPPVDAANRVAAQLRDGDPANGEADVVVLLVHEGAATTAVEAATDPGTRFGRLVNGASGDIDAIVSGHSHRAYNHVIDGRPVISSGQYGEKFSNMLITVDPVSKAVLSMENTINVLAGTLTEDPAVAAIVATATAEAEELGSRRLGTLTADFNRARQPDAEGSTPVESRGGESTIGNFIADAQLWAVRQRGHADLAVMHPGGIRTDLRFASDGVVSYRDAAGVQPFANPLMTQRLSGAQLKELLEQQWQPQDSSRPFRKLGVSKQLSYSYDPGAPAGAHVTRILLDGVPIDPAASYTVVANAFIAFGGDSFTALAAGTDQADTGLIDTQTLVDWFAAHGTASPDYAQRAVGVVLSAPDADGYSTGDALTITLSSLDFSTTEPAAGIVHAAIGGVDLGSAPVDRTISPDFDETGTAVIQTTVPAGLTGEQTLQLTVPTTGTSVTVPISLGAATPPGPTPLPSPAPAPPPGAALAATGVDGPGLALGFAGGILLLVAGAALFLVRRRQKR